MVQESDWGLLGKVFWVFLLGGAHEISQLAWTHVTVSSDGLKDVAKEREVWSFLLTCSTIYHLLLLLLLLNIIFAKLVFKYVYIYFFVSRVSRIKKK